MNGDRFDRQVRLFGQEGQAKIASARVAVAGIGGLGSHVVQQLALLGAGRLALIDNEELDETNRNRYVVARFDDPIPGTRKVDLGERTARAINPSIEIVKIHDSLVSEPAFTALRQADYVFGCLDSEGARLILTELCSAYSRPYFDLASDIIPGEPPVYGGRVCIAWDGQGCLVCFGILDMAEAQMDLLDPAARQNRDAIYGIHREDLARTGPSVVSINGVVASLAVTEFMVAATGLRHPKPVVHYYGHMGRVAGPTLDTMPLAECYYCKGIRDRGNRADVERFIREGIGQVLR